MCQDQHMLIGADIMMMRLIRQVLEEISVANLTQIRLSEATMSKKELSACWLRVCSGPYDCKPELTWREKNMNDKPRKMERDMQLWNQVLVV